MKVFYHRDPNVFITLSTIHYLTRSFSVSLCTNFVATICLPRIQHTTDRTPGRRRERVYFFLPDHREHTYFFSTHLYSIPLIIRAAEARGRPRGSESPLMEFVKETKRGIRPANYSGILLARSPLVRPLSQSLSAIGPISVDGSAKGASPARSESLSSGIPWDFVPRDETASVGASASTGRIIVFLDLSLNGQRDENH